jgi:hypothetical protein
MSSRHLKKIILPIACLSIIPIITINTPPTNVDNVFSDVIPTENLVAENKIDINTVITNTNIGVFHNLPASLPTNRDINSALKVANNPDGSKNADWYPNQ